MNASCKPVANAVVELWHASPSRPGAEAGATDATYDSSASFRYYGQVATDAAGRYEFLTLRPGWYLNAGTYRPAHLHVKVWVGNVDTPQLTTQLYFDGDPFNHGDPWFNAAMSLLPDAMGNAEKDLIVSEA